MADSYLSKEKTEELTAKLQRLKTESRIDIAGRLKRAKEHGDLSENFEYAQAKEDQEKLEREIFDLENLLKEAHLITKPKNKSAVSVGLSVTLKDKKGTIAQYTIVGSQEADPFHNKISNASPIGKALLGKKVGERATIKTPRGAEVEYTIVEIA
ncbi:MAG: transcription elongation factor GreA [Candidatus Paceibacterota bacterium]|jgi:transcription elongation factor GreA